MGYHRAGYELQSKRHRNVAGIRENVGGFEEGFNGNRGGDGEEREEEERGYQELVGHWKRLILFRRKLQREREENFRD